MDKPTTAETTRNLRAAATISSAWGGLMEQAANELETALRKVRSEELANMILNTDKERAEAIIKDIGELRRHGFVDYEVIDIQALGDYILYDELQAIINGENHDYNQV